MAMFTKYSYKPALITGKSFVEVIDTHIQKILNQHGELV
jgi:hypothetical protein